MRRLGATLVLAGSMFFLHVAHQVWGTGIVTSRAQSALRADVARGLPPTPIPGHAIGFLEIPRLGLDMAFVEGIDAESLAKGPGHYPKSALPGEAGNVAIAGHRTTHLAPFWALDSLRRGDRIELETRAGRFVYRVVWEKVVDPYASWTVQPTRRSSLTLTTCNPRFSAAERLVVRAVQTTA